jgi:HEAT repeat protein
MTRNEALDILRRHQPLPPDELLTQEMLDDFDAARGYFEEHPDDECVPLLLNSFGGRDAFGLYEGVEGAILKQSPEVVINHLQNSLRSPHRSVRYWSTQIAASFPDPRLLDPLTERLQENDQGMSVAAALALGCLGTEEANAALRAAKAATTDKELIEHIDASLPEANLLFFQAMAESFPSVGALLQEHLKDHGELRPQALMADVTWLLLADGPDRQAIVQHLEESYWTMSRALVEAFLDRIETKEEFDRLFAGVRGPHLRTEWKYKDPPQRL